MLSNHLLNKIIISIKALGRVPGHNEYVEKCNYLTNFLFIIEENLLMFVMLIHYWYMYKILSVYGEMLQSSDGSGKLGNKGRS